MVRSWPAWSGPQEFHGRDEFLRFFADWIDAYAEWDQEIEGVIDAGGNQVVETTRQRGRLRGSDSWIDWRYGIVYTVEEGLIRRGKLYGTPEEVEVVKASYEAFASGGLDRYMEHFTDDVVFRAVEGAPDEPGPIHGKDAVRAWLQDWIDMFDGYWEEPVELIDAGGDTVVAVERFGGRQGQRCRNR